MLIQKRNLLTLIGNCKTRLPASHFQVKKEGPNRGKWFYTCQEPKGSGCGFFLWDDNAKGREAHAVLNNSRFENDDLRTPADAARDKRTIEGHAAASNRFMADLRKADEDEFGSWLLSPEDEKKLVQAADTPRKAVKLEHFSTPGSKRKRDEDTLPTPSTGANPFNTIRKDEEPITPASRLKGGMWDGNEYSRNRSPSATPTPSRFRESTVTSEASQDRPQLNYDISDEVMDILKDQKIDEETTGKLRQTLNRHALKISGIAKGRDITRLALKAKDVKIAELQQRISALETERELDKTIIRHFKSDMAQSIEKRRGRGRGKI